MKTIKESGFFGSSILHLQTPVYFNTYLNIVNELEDLTIEEVEIYRKSQSPKVSL
jgi:hypothetical protein